ncbi:hypothetical protein GCM10020220_102130 [Nonomuraea rubra]|uniref:hypothetical protein n=1 Tax=Nonomuraea rubra TaxID=46180 RepID=UPI0031EAAC35
MITLTSTLLSAAAILAIAASPSAAQDDINVLNCNSIRVIDVPILSTNNDNIDCSRNMTHINIGPKM